MESSVSASWIVSISFTILLAILCVTVLFCLSWLCYSSYMITYGANDDWTLIDNFQLLWKLRNSVPLGVSLNDTGREPFTQA